MSEGSCGLLFRQGCSQPAGTMEPDTEAQLTREVIRGDRAALAELLRQSQQRLFNIVLRMVGDPDDAVDVTQEAMVNIIDRIDTYRGRPAMATWMIRIAITSAVSHMRRRQSRQTVGLESPRLVAGVEDQSTRLRQQVAAERQPDPDRSASQRQTVEHLSEALARLDESFKTVLVLRDIERMEYHQIGRVLAIPAGTVKSRLFRARLSLRHEMLKLTALRQVQGGAPEEDNRVESL